VDLLSRLPHQSRHGDARWRMDGSRFDELTRTLATPTSRRRTLRLLAGGALAAVTAALGVGEAGATHTGCRHHGKSCARNKQCCSGRCAGSGVCKCPGGTTRCGTTACCAAGESCQNGTCVAACVGDCTGKDCGDNGCGVSCGECTAPATCGGGGTPGICGGGGCTATSCTGGRVCQPDGSCACPPDKQHVAPQQFCDDTCRECCTDNDCGGFNGMVCDHSQGSICVCAVGFDCGQGVCYPCCNDQQCSNNGVFYCDVQDHLCKCPQGMTACYYGNNESSCVDLTSNNTCGTGCNAYGPCTDGRVCINHTCEFPM